MRLSVLFVGRPVEERGEQIDLSVFVRTELTVFVPGYIGEMEAGPIDQRTADMRMAIWRKRGEEPILMQRTVTVGPWVVAP